DPIAFKIVEGFGLTSPEDCVRLKDFSGCIVAKRALRFLPHTPLEVAVPKRRACKGVSCSSNDTCVAGVCVPATISDESACARAGGCTEGDLGPPDGDAGTDAGSAEAGVDATIDATIDATSDAPSDARADVSIDAPNDVGTDSGAIELSLG